jgi:hypothetical protein
VIVVRYNAFMAITVMVPNHVWAPNFFGPKEIWSLHENHYMAFLCRDQVSWGQNFSGPKKSGAQKRLATISVIVVFH